MAAAGVLTLVGATAAGWWATDRLAERLERWAHTGRAVYSVDFVNLAPRLTLVEVYCGDGTRATYWSPGVPHVDETALYRRFCAEPPAVGSADVDDG